MEISLLQQEISPQQTELPLQLWDIGQKQMEIILHQREEAQKQMEKTSTAMGYGSYASDDSFIGDWALAI